MRAALSIALVAAFVLSGCDRQATQKAPVAETPPTATSRQTDPSPTSSTVAQSPKEKGKETGKGPPGKSPTNKPKFKGAVNPDVLAICELLADDPEKKTRDESLSRLEVLYPELFPLVVTLMVEEPGSGQHASAIASVGKLGAKAADALPLLMKEWQRIVKLCGKGLKYGQGSAMLQYLVSNTAQAMVKISPGNTLVMDAIIPMTAFPDRDIRLRLFELLTPIAAADEPSAKYLLPAFIARRSDSSDNGAREYVIDCLGRIGPLAKDAVEPLRAMRFDENIDIRTAAIEALRKIDVE